MKFLASILLIIVTLAVTVILPVACQKNTNGQEAETIEPPPLSAFIVLPDRVTSCPQGQRKDHHGNCRPIA
ncbi:hypothetical protein X777_16787 [Ooceraea biroi]|uniref:Uncharacterized protein n=1 Tax=Ooceraea biroi TaxID=2015173 RepID=A0A026WUD8_OOCBI|nr:hypothetical protein X777_16787 [Ooceraea biroi]